MNSNCLPDIQQFSSDSTENNRRLVVSPSPSYTQEIFDNEYSDDYSLDEVQATLYTGSPFLSLPTFSPRSPFPQTMDPVARLSKITEVTEESRPTSIAASTSATNFLHPTNPTPDGLRRSAVLGGGSSASHSREIGRASCRERV